MPIDIFSLLTVGGLAFIAWNLKAIQMPPKHYSQLIYMPYDEHFMQPEYTNGETPIQQRMHRGPTEPSPMQWHQDTINWMWKTNESNKNIYNKGVAKTGYYTEEPQYLVDNYA